MTDRDPGHPCGRFRVFSGLRSQVQSTAVEVDGVDKVALIAKCSRRVLDPSNLRIDRFAAGVGDAYRK